MKIKIVTDTWHPQINGVVTTLSHVDALLKKRGHDVQIISPANFKNVPCPTYPEIKLALYPGKKLERYLSDADAIYIANEGPLGFWARRYCLKREWPFSSGFHTRLAEYINNKFGFIPKSWGYKYMQWFHSPSRAVMVPTKTQGERLMGHGFKNVVMWSRGVNTELFRPHEVVKEFKSPILLYVGRISVEKNVEAFLKLKTNGSKVVVGDGPDTSRLKIKYPDANWLGYKQGQELAKYYAMADAFVFPSITDTFGNVQLEALASGIPVAAFPTTGPMDIITDQVGHLSHNLQEAVDVALTKERKACRSHALEYSWSKCVDIFEDNLRRIDHYG